MRVLHNAVFDSLTMSRPPTTWTIGTRNILQILVRDWAPLRLLQYLDSSPGPVVVQEDVGSADDHEHTETDWESVEKV